MNCNDIRIKRSAMSLNSRQIRSSQIDAQHEVHFLHGRVQRSRQVNGAGVVHHDVDPCSHGKDRTFNKKTSPRVTALFVFTHLRISARRSPPPRSPASHHEHPRYTAELFLLLLQLRDKTQKLLKPH